ncbi:MAG: hypothetical protein K8L99_32915 [Anaerolineae bacterium]|nr:hypothetical protein [Anaerolineae bacterium]
MYKPKAESKAALKSRILEAIQNSGSGLLRKQVAYAVGLQPSNRDLASVLDSLVTEKLIYRSGAVGAGYRYLPVKSDEQERIS